jgi:non-heme chloroperoxidase
LATAPGPWICLWALALASVLSLPAAAAQPAKPGKPVTVTSRHFHTSDGVRLHVLEAGNAKAATGRPVLAFVTGWSMPASIWRPQFDALAARYRMAALDPRGQGLSDVPGEGYTADRRADDVAEFVAQYPNVVLVGWSLGALEVLHYVHRHGEAKVAGVVLVDSSVGEEPAPPPGSFRDDLRADRAGTLRSFVQAIFRKPLPPGDAAQIFAGAMRMPLDASIELLSWPIPRTHWRDVAWALRKPLLYVVTPQFGEQSTNLARNRPGTQVELFQNAGHALFVDDPVRFNALLERFAQSVTAKR